MILNVPISGKYVPIRVEKGRVGYSLNLIIDGYTSDEGFVTNYYLSMFPYQGKIVVVGSICTVWKDEDCIPILVSLEPEQVAPIYTEIFDYLLKKDEGIGLLSIISNFLDRQDVLKYSPIILKLLSNKNIQETAKTYYEYGFAHSVSTEPARAILEPYIGNLDQLIVQYRTGSITALELMSAIFDRLNSSNSVPERVGKFKVIRNGRAPQFR